MQNLTGTVLEMGSTREKSLEMNLRFQMCSIEYIVMALVERENSGTGFFFFSVLLSV